MVHMPRMVEMPRPKHAAWFRRPYGWQGAAGTRATWVTWRWMVPADRTGCMCYTQHMSLRMQPVTFKFANGFVQRHHRHHKPTQGHKFSLGVAQGKKIVGVAVVGRPVARGSDNGWTLEVTRLCTDGTPNACSMLYGAAARAAKAMGYLKIQTYILSSEDGASLRAAGWFKEAEVRGRDWNNGSKTGRRTDQPMDDKERWVRILGSND